MGADVTENVIAHNVTRKTTDIKLSEMTLDGKMFCTKALRAIFNVVLWFHKTSIRHAAE